jgi:peptidoglycan/xylan/chitin deacetylase (PgdA/CDA1 family)
MRSGTKGRRTATPILMYHGIREGVGNRHPYFETNTTPKRFREHMQFIRSRGYTVMGSPDSLRAGWALGSVKKHVVVTFDDGYRDFYTNALPILVELGIPATLYVVSGFTDDQNRTVNRREFMSWSEIREAHRLGMTIGSHTVNHPKLHGMDPRQVSEELKQSKQSIEDALGAPVTAFSYPFAFPEQDVNFVNMVRACLREHGYQSGVSTVLGTATPDDDAYFLPRLPANSYDDLTFLQAKLEGGYDWLRAVQRGYKRFLKGADRAPTSLQPVTRS